MGFRGTEARWLLEQTGLSEAPVLRTSGAEASALIMRIYDARGSLPHQQAYMTGALYQLLALLMRDHGAQPVRRAEDCVRRACQFVEDNFSLPIGVTDIAAHVGLSRSRLYRLFVAETALSPAQYLAQYRMRRACALLLRGDLSVKAVAASVGFDDPLYFSRRFREIMGVSPTEYAAARAPEPASGG